MDLAITVLLTMLKHSLFLIISLWCGSSTSKYLVVIKQLSTCGFTFEGETSIKYFPGIYQSSIKVLSHQSVSDQTKGIRKFLFVSVFPKPIPKTAVILA